MEPEAPAGGTGDDAGLDVRGALRHPGRSLKALTGNGPLLPLLVLFGFQLCEALDRSAMTVLTPNIRDAFGLTNAQVLSMGVAAAAVGLLLAIPMAAFADRYNRVRLLIAGSAVFALFSFSTGLAFAVWFLVIARIGTGAGLATSIPTHNSLIADYYAVDTRPRVLAFRQSADAFGMLIGPFLAGLIANLTDWHVPFLVFAIPTMVLVVVAFRMREPVRGLQERKMMGASAEVMALEEQPPTYEEAKRMVDKIASLQRIFRALPFLGVSLIGYGFFAGLLYQEQFGLNELQRGTIQSLSEPAQILGIVIGGIVATRVVKRDPGLIVRFVGVVSFVAAGLAAVFALTPVLWLGVAANMLIAASLAAVLPGVFAALQLAVPPRVRSIGIALGARWLLPIVIVVPFVGWVADNWGIRVGMLVMTPLFVIGGVIIGSAGKLLDADIRNAWTATTARSELLHERREGRAKLLLVRNLDVAYGDVQILFDVDFEVDEGEIVALLGTNGAGKSTLLKAISGVVAARRGVVILDGRDITYAPAYEIARLGVAQVPGGQGTFPTLTVAENLRVAGWMERHSRIAAASDGTFRSKLRATFSQRRPADAEVKARIETVLETFPILRQRLEDPAANLSGGQQQMLALGMAFLSRPKLLIIDELSLGLAPVIVEQLLGIVRAIRDQGTTVILVEQSVNVALTLAETAYFMEKGEIRFHGPTAELLERPDVLRSVFLEGAQKGLAAVDGGNGRRPTGEAPADEPPGGEPSADRARTGEPAAAAADAVTAAPGPDGDAPAALEVAGVSVRFGGIRAVDDVSLSVAPGEIVGIIGPNGAGKTTLFDLISGFTRADTGRVLLAGHDVTRRSPDARARRGLGRSFQDARLFPALTVEDTLAVALERWIPVKDPFNAMLRLPAQQDAEFTVRRRVDELIELMGIESFRSKFVHELSTGSRRVVDLACVIAHHPSVVLLDEPSSGIAQREAEALGPLLRRIRDSLGASLLVIEHDMPLVTSIADRLIALDQGRVIAVGVPDEVLRHPEVVASYLGNDAAAIERSGSRGDDR